jgi:hypothetical protein
MIDKERRKYARIVSHNLVSYVCQDQAGRMLRHGMGRTLDVNPRGILIETLADVESDCRLSLAIGLKDETIQVGGRVIHQEKGPEGRCRSGIAFDPMDDKTAAALDLFISEFQDEPRPAR